VNNQLIEHEEFKELAAMAALNELTAAERLRLEDHLRSCKDCAEIYQQYLVLYGEIIPFIGSQRDHVEYPEKSMAGPWRERLFRRIQADEQRSAASGDLRRGFVPDILPRLSVAGVAVTLLVSGISFFLGGKVLGHRWAEPQRLAESRPVSTRRDPLEVGKAEVAQNLQRRLDEQTAKVQDLVNDQTSQERQLEKMRSSLKDLTEREAVLRSSNATSKAQLKEVTEQRDALRNRIATAEESYATIQSQLAALLSERDVALAKNADLESKVARLSLEMSDKERRIMEDEQFLNSDRDIRDLMGARQLYIADVFDVDSRSRTRPPFGRIFYTHGKSLIFYAFDLDNQKGAVRASAFQVWGKSANAKMARSLGILYLDNESSRRWLLRSDNAEQLEKMDSVFVTVEPQGGSPKPTGKPFLYALLRKEPNHP
jgi:hypothetical protein